MKVLAVAPYEGLKEFMLSLSEQEDFDSRVEAGDLQKGVSLLSEAINSDTDIIISRGGTAELIQKENKIAHGVANSMQIPHVMKFNMDSIEERLARVADPMGMTTENASTADLVKMVVEQIASWTSILEIPQDLKDFGVTEEDVPDLALSASKVTRLLNNNPKPLSIGEIEAIYRCLCS